MLQITGVKWLDIQMIEGFRISTDREEMDLDAIHAFVSKSYWARGIPKETMRRALENSLCFAIFHESGTQIGFARAVSDFATHAYLADVYVLEEYRGMGLGRWLIQEVVSHPALCGLKRIMLATRDAHGLYEKYGFKAVASPDMFMEAWNPDVYKDE